MSDVVVHFPWLHPMLGQGPLPEGVVFFDPGVEVRSAALRWRPEDLPLSALEVRRMVRDYMQFAERFPRVSDMQAYQAVGLDNFFTDTTMDIMSQLTGGSPAAAPSERDRRQQAQLLLALALFREEQYVAMSEQENRFESARSGFAEVLGLDDEESFAELGVADAELFPRASAELPWKSVLAPLAGLLPEGTRLFVSDPDVLRDIVDSGAQFSPCVLHGEDMRCATLDADLIECISGARAELAGPLTLITRPMNL